MTDQSVDKEKKALRYTRLNETKAFFFFIMPRAWYEYI